MLDHEGYYFRSGRRTSIAGFSHKTSPNVSWKMDDNVVLPDANVVVCPEVLAGLVRSSQSSTLLMDETVK